MEQLNLRTGHLEQVERDVDTTAYTHLCTLQGIAVTTANLESFKRLFTYIVELDQDGIATYTFKRRSFTPRPR